MKFKITLIIGLSCLYFNVTGQSLPAPQLPTVIPSSPQAAQLTRYGEIPVGHTTGVPQIDIPIYTLSTGWIDIPISISYHASGFRVRDIPSPVGLGWVLNAGGVITRTVEMKADFENNDAFIIKSLSDLENLKNGFLQPLNVNFSHHSSCFFWENFLFNAQNNTAFDTRTDRYAYNFLGNTGIARYDIDSNRLLPIPYAPLTIQRISNNHYTITDTKGIVYEFTYPENTRSSSSYQSAATGWYITKITYPGMESSPITFSYTTATPYSEVIYNQSTSVITGLMSCDVNAPWAAPGCTGSCPPIGKSETRMNIQTIYYNSPIITSIEWKDIKIEFTYLTDRQDQRKERLTSVIVKDRNNIVRQALLDNNSYMGNTTKNYRLKLSGISLYGNTTNEKPEVYQFFYNGNTYDLPDYYRYSTKLCNEDLWGYYNAVNSNFALPTEMGQYLYNIVRSYPYNSYSSSESAVRTPNELCTKTCVLEQIVYPTKGKTRFEYEINRIPNFYINFNNSREEKVGGLRLKKKINYLETGTVSDIKEYQYEGYGTMQLRAEMFIGHRQVVTTYGNGIPTTVYYTLGLSSPMLSLTGWDTSPIFYNKVTEYNGETNNNIGKTIYEYSADNLTFPNICYYDGPGYSPMNFSIYNHCDKGNVSGLLKSATTFNQAGTIIKKKVNTYHTYDIPYIHTGVHLAQIREFSMDFQTIIDFERSALSNMGVHNWDPQFFFERNFLDNIVGINSYSKQEVSLLKNTVETEYINETPFIEKTTTYSYDVQDGKPVQFIPSSVSQTNSKGQVYTETTIFPYHTAYRDRIPYSMMNTKYMLEYPVEQKIHVGSDTLQNTYTTYMSFPGNLILPNQISVSQGNNQSPEERITYHKYDSQGNPVFMTKDGNEYVVHLWGYNYHYPIIQVQGATYDEVKAALGYSDAQVESLASQSTPSATLISQLSNTLRNNLSKDTRVTSFTYKPSVGILTMTDSRGVVTNYDYDGSGRLIEVSENTGAGKKILERFEYNLRNY